MYFSTKICIRLSQRLAHIDHLQQVVAEGSAERRGCARAAGGRPRTGWDELSHSLGLPRYLASVLTQNWVTSSALLCLLWGTEVLSEYLNPLPE